MLTLKLLSPFLADLFSFIQAAKATEVLLAQFDGSAHRQQVVGGAGAVLLYLTAAQTQVLRWTSIALAPCRDNVEAEIRACLEAIQLVKAVQTQRLADGLPALPIIIQGDILPVLNFLNNRSRMRTVELSPALHQCKQGLAALGDQVTLTYLPRECNKLADYFAGYASARAKDDSLEHDGLCSPPFPFHLLLPLGFDICYCPMDSGYQPYLRESPDVSGALFRKVLSCYRYLVRQFGRYLQLLHDQQDSYVARYRPVAYDGEGRLYSDTFSAQQFPKALRIALFAQTHTEIDISGAHHELVRRLTRTTELPHINDLRSMLWDIVAPLCHSEQVSSFVKRWPLIILNAESLPKAISIINHYLHLPMPPGAVAIAKQLRAAASQLLADPPPQLTLRSGTWTTGQTFRSLEMFEKEITWYAYEFLHEACPFQSAIWLHDGFWVCPAPSSASLTLLHERLSRHFSLKLDDPPLFRCESLLDAYARVEQQFQNATPVSLVRLSGPFPARPVPNRIIRKRGPTRHSPETMEQQVLRLEKRRRRSHQ